MIIKVTAEDIRDGRRANSQHCPVARALSRELGHPVSVGCNTWRQIGDLNEVVLPESAIAWIEWFDKEMPVKPFSFRIRRPR